MSDPLDVSHDDDVVDRCELIDLLVSDFLARYRDGEQPTIDEYARRHPSLSAEIHRIFPMMASIENIKLSDPSSSGTRATLAGRTITRLGDFRIIREIGRGGMGIVFEAEQESLGRHVAIKVLPKHSLLDQDSLARFHNEAQTAAAMHHTNIVPIFGTGEEDGIRYLVMQLVRGESLDKKLISRSDGFPFAEVANMGRQIADAVAYAHSNGVLHRDIKPANILIDEDGNAQITDFGLAKPADDGVTKSRSLSGSLRYVAPERFHGLSDRRSDIYSLGLTLYEMVTHRPAFVEEDGIQLIEAVKNPQPRTIQRYRPDVPIDLETIVLKAMHPDPALRYQHAVDLRDDLHRFLIDEPILARRATWPERSRRWLRRNRVLAVSASLAASALLIATVASTAAYWVTSAANVRSSVALRNSEETVSLALQSLEGVVDTVSFSPSLSGVELFGGGGIDDQSTWFDATFAPSPTSEQILNRVQPLFERLAHQAPSRSDVILQMIDAAMQLGRIQHQLGRTSAAITTLQTSLDRLDEGRFEARLDAYDKNLRIARLQNELGRFFRSQHDVDRADESHRLAIESASLLPHDDFHGQYELARANHFLGSTPLPRRLDRGVEQTLRADRSQHIERALHFLDRIRDADGGVQSVEILYAASLLAKSRLAVMPPIKHHTFDRGIAILRTQLEKSPNDASIQFELVQALADVHLRREAPPRQLAANAARLQRALDELKPLRLSFPNTPVFTTAEVHLRHKLSGICRFQNDLTLAQSHVAEAIRLQTALVEGSPENMVHRCWIALLHRSLAQIHEQQGNRAQATETILKAVDALNQIEPDQQSQPFSLQTRGIVVDVAASLGLTEFDHGKTP